MYRFGNVFFRMYHNAIIGVFNSGLFHILIVLILIDVITGYAKAYKNKIVYSNIGTNGIIRHVIIIILQVFIGVFSRVYGVDYVSIVLCLFNIGNYGISILENLNKLGIPFPKGIEKYFMQMSQVDFDDKEVFKDDVKRD